MTRRRRWWDATDGIRWLGLVLFALLLWVLVLVWLVR